jgi:ribonuclease G
VSTSKKGTSGDEPAAPNGQDGLGQGAEATSASGEGAPRRRRGNRGGRRHKRPAAAAGDAAQVQAKSPTPREGYAAAAGALAALPTAPLIPVGAAEAAARDQVAVDDAESDVSAPGGEGAQAREPRAPSGRSRGGRGRAKAKAATPEAPAAAPATALAESETAPTGEPAGGSAGDATPAGEGEETHAKRRRRGGRGGRRRRKTADIEHEEAAREAEEAAGEPMASGALADEAAAEQPPGEGADGAEAGETGVKRRRGARGGRRTRGKGEVAAAEPSPAPEAVGESPAGSGSVAGPAKAPADESKSRRPRDRRRPRAIVRQDEGSGLDTIAPIELGQRRHSVVAERPERKIILVTDDGEELRVALVEDGRLSEIYIERPDRKSYLGDIYQGKVENVMSGIDAAFVDFGLEKNGFLYVDEVTAPEGEKRARRISDALKNGQQVLVQVTKDPMGHKGARLSTKISLAGRYLVYVPGGSGVGVSRRLKQSERERLRDISKELKPKDAGLIVRTIAEGHGLEDLRRDMRYLSRLWSRLKKKAETVKAPGLVHKEVDISLEVTRDLFNDTCESLIVDDAKRHKAILSFLDKEAPELLPKVHLHTGEEPLFDAYGIEEQIAKALERRVPLPSGGNLMIDHAEALTVIDVNTGRFTRGKGLEDTITKTNLEAAREVVRQLRLRDIGGIIIIDFIDMAHAKNREMVLATLEAELETDRTKTYVVELSPLGLVEMTRQNTTDGARGILTRACPTCQGRARVLSEETMALSVERRVRALARKSQAKAWLIEVNAAVAERLSGARLKRLEKQTGRRVFLEGGSALPVDALRVISEGSIEHVQEQRVPVREGQEVTVELEFSLTYSPRDAVGYVDGYMVIVEGGRQHLGKRRKVRVTEIARTGARATVLKKDAN